MASCAHCKTEETQLYENGVPICLKCAAIRDRQVSRSSPTAGGDIRIALVEDLLKTTAQFDVASREFSTALRDIPGWPPQPDGTQHIKNISHKLTAARKDMMRAHNRLNDYVERGIVPEDLKRASEEPSASV
jgi:hypothetical protein